MSDTFSRWSQAAPPVFTPGRAGLPVGALDGVRSRRMLAVCLDLIVVSILSFGLWFVLLISTFGLALALLPPLFPLVAFFYNGLSVSGRRMATPGMRFMDLEMRTRHTGDQVSFLAAALHAVLFYFSWTFPPVFLWTLFSADKQCLHDVLANVIVTRRL